MEVAKLSAPPNLQVRSVSCNESAIKRWLSSELEETVFSLTHELFMTQHLVISAVKAWFVIIPPSPPELLPSLHVTSIVIVFWFECFC